MVTTYVAPAVVVLFSRVYCTCSSVHSRRHYYLFLLPHPICYHHPLPFCHCLWFNMCLSGSQTFLPVVSVLRLGSYYPAPVFSQWILALPYLLGRLTWGMTRFSFYSLSTLPPYTYYLPVLLPCHMTALPGLVLTLLHSHTLHLFLLPFSSHPVPYLYSQSCSTLPSHSPTSQAKHYFLPAPDHCLMMIVVGIPVSGFPSSSPILYCLPLCYYFPFYLFRFQTWDVFSFSQFLPQVTCVCYVAGAYPSGSACVVVCFLGLLPCVKPVTVVIIIVLYSGPVGSVPNLPPMPALHWFVVYILPTMETFFTICW